jgi:hypothetical protein
MDRINLVRALLLAGWGVLSGTPAVAQLEWKHKEAVAPMAAAQEEVIARFPFRNAGTQPISIKSIESFCGCTTVSLSQRHFNPGESGEVVATYTPGHRMGIQRNVISVQTDFPAAPKTVLTVTAEVPVVAKLERAILLWKEDDLHETKSLDIETSGRGLVEAIAVKSVDAALDARVERINDTMFRLLVTPRAGGVSSAVVLEASLRGNQKKRLSAYVRVR